MVDLYAYLMRYNYFTRVAVIWVLMFGRKATIFCIGNGCKLQVQVPHPVVLPSESPGKGKYTITSHNNVVKLYML